MGLIISNFDRYKIRYFSGSTGNGASINLASSSGGVGELIFLATSPIPANQLSETGLPFLFFERVRFRDVVTILREEKPLLLVYDTDTKVGWIQTGEFEPIGEAEPTR